MKIFMNRLSAAIAVCVAQQAWTANELATIETVEVYGRAMPPAIDSTERSLHSPGRETGDTLRDLLGVSGSRMGGHGIDPTIRGLTQTQLNVLLDGAYVHGGCPNRMDPPTSYASATAYEEITVIRGTQTLAYGGGGPGGTVVFSRKTPEFEPDHWIQGEFSASWRSNSNTRSLGGDVSLGGPQGYVRLLTSSTDNGNYEDGNGDELRSSYKEDAGSIIVAWTPKQGQQVELSWDHQKTHDALFPGAGMDSPDATNNTLRLRLSSAELGDFSNLKLELYRSDVDHIMDNFSLRSSAMMKMKAPSTSDTFGGRLIAELDSHIGLWKFGVDGQYNDRAATRSVVGPVSDTLNSVMWPEVNIDQTGAFAELTNQLTPSLRVRGGLRYDHVRSRAKNTATDPDGMPLSPQQLYTLYYGESPTTRLDRNIGGLLRLDYRPDTSNTRLYAGFSRSVRTPDATERYLASNGMVPSARWVGNPGLNPEVHHQAEFGLLKKTGLGLLELSLYTNLISDYILRDRFDASGNNASIYRNVDARLIGGEGRMTWQFGGATHLELGASYVNAENTTDNRAVAQIPALEGFAVLRWEAKNWQISGELRGAAKQHRVDTTSSTGIAGQGLDVRETPGWGVFNLRARWALTANAHIEFGIDNVMDKAYAQHLNRGNAFDPAQIQVNEPGRSGWISLQASL